MWGQLSVSSPEQSLSTLSFLMARWYRQAQRVFHMLVGLVFLGLAVAGVTLTAAEWKFYRQAPSVGLTQFALLAGSLRPPCECGARLSTSAANGSAGKRNRLAPVLPLDRAADRRHDGGALVSVPSVTSRLVRSQAD